MHESWALTSELAGTHFAIHIPRFTLVRLDGKTVTAFVVFAEDGTIEGKPCFAIGMPFPKRIETKDAQRKLSKQPS